MGLLSTSEFEPKCADSVSDEIFSMTFLLHSNSS